MRGILTVTVLSFSAIATFTYNVSAEQETAKRALTIDEREKVISDTEKQISKARNVMEEAADFQGNYAEENVEGESVSFQTVTNNGETITYDHKARNYLKTPVMQDEDFVAGLAVEERTQVDEETGQPVWYYRTNMTGFSYAKESLFPQERTFGYLYDFELWKIVGNEEVAGRNCWKIEGGLEGDYSEKLNVKSYVFFVDMETGCLLKYEGYDEEGGLTEFIDTKEIEFNEPIAVEYQEEANDVN